MEKVQEMRREISRCCVCERETTDRDMLFVVRCDVMQGRNDTIRPGYIASICQVCQDSIQSARFGERFEAMRNQIRQLVKVEVERLRTAETEKHKS